MAAEVVAVVVNYNAGAELRRALQSIVDELSDRSWEGIVVDNASADGSGAIATEFGPQISLVRNAENVGFGKAVNQAAAVSHAPMLLIMNPDCRLMSGSLARLESELVENAGCAVVGPRILNPDGSNQGSARGDPDMMTGLFGRASRFRRWLPWLPVSRRNVVPDDHAGPADGSVAVDWVSGACMLVRRDAFERAAGFDERYFLYWEDADLCRRLRGLGYHVRHVPGAVAVHRVGHSSRGVRLSALRAFHESAYLYYTTHLAPGARHPKRLLARALLGARCWWLSRTQ